MEILCIDLLFQVISIVGDCLSWSVDQFQILSHTQAKVGENGYLDYLKWQSSNYIDAPLLESTSHITFCTDRVTSQTLHTPWTSLPFDAQDLSKVNLCLNLVKVTLTCCMFSFFFLHAILILRSVCVSLFWQENVQVKGILQYIPQTICCFKEKMRIQFD